MRQEEITILEREYLESEIDSNDRFAAAIGSEIPSANLLTSEILSDFESNFGIAWWTSTPIHNRILIGDYLYQCADAIEGNLIEAKLHYWEWLHVRELQNRWIVDTVKMTPEGELTQEILPPLCPADELRHKLEALHLCGFFRAVGSSLDCLGGAIIGVLGLNTKLRRNDIIEARKALGKTNNPQTAGAFLQVEFNDFLTRVIQSSGPADWLEWTDRYRNMFVHRGRRLFLNTIHPRDPILLDSKGRPNLKASINLHLVKNPDQSDMESFVFGDSVLNEDADITLKGIFQSCQNLNEEVCRRLLEVWQQRRADPTLIEQPESQWTTNGETHNFAGYQPQTPRFDADTMTANPTLGHRIQSGSAMDSDRKLWNNTPWKP